MLVSIVDVLVLEIVVEVLGVISVVTDIVVVELFETEVVLDLVTGGAVLSVGESAIAVVSIKPTACVESPSCAFVSR